MRRTATALALALAACGSENVATTYTSPSNNPNASLGGIGQKCGYSEMRCEWTFGGYPPLNPFPLPFCACKTPQVAPPRDGVEAHDLLIGVAGKSSEGRYYFDPASYAAAGDGDAQRAAWVLACSRAAGTWSDGAVARFRALGDARVGQLRSAGAPAPSAYPPGAQVTAPEASIWARLTDEQLLRALLVAGL